MKTVQHLSVVVLAATLLGGMPQAQGKDKYEVVTELEFMANKMRLVGQTVALLTYLGDIMDVGEREVPTSEKETTTHAISAATFRGMVRFTIPETKANEETIQLFYTLAPGTQSQRGSRITIYGKVIKVSDKDVFILVQREGGGLAIEEGWPEAKDPCPTCGRPGYAGERKPPATPPKPPKKGFK